MERGHIFNKNYLSSIIYEASIKDFTSFFDIEDKSTYSAFTRLDLKNNKGLDAGFSHIKKLGINTIQLMPIFLFGAVDEENKNKFYNWGYNPVLYNTPSGLYSINPNEPYSRINELKKMIDEIHNNNISVVMDVVYNHVFDFNTYPIEILSPGYMFNYDKDAMLTKVSGCKNDVNTKRVFIKRFIINSILYWVNEYKIDGFRFDLMGLIDIDTMNEIERELHLINKNILIYGEGWKMIDDLSYCHMYNDGVNKDISFFNDFYRNTIKNYLIGNIDKVSLNNIFTLKNSLFRYPHNSINYIECHDEYTLYDYLKEFKFSEEKNRALALLAESILLLSPGIPFIHSGMEFFRSKNHVRDTYNDNSGINAINWDNLSEYSFNHLKEFINLRQKYEYYNIDNIKDINTYTNISFTNLNTIIISIDYKEKLKIIFKIDEKEEDIEMPNNPIYTNISISNNKVSGIGVIVIEE